MRNLIILTVIVIVVYGLGVWKFYKLNKELDKELDKEKLKKVNNNEEEPLLSKLNSNSWFRR